MNCGAVATVRSCIAGPGKEEQVAASLLERFETDFRYFEETLDLPEEVLRKFYYENAAGLYREPR